MTNLTHLLDCSVQNYADHIALSIRGEKAEISFSFRALQEKALLLARSLKAKGIGCGDNIALITPNTPIWGVIFFGVLYAGATLVPIDTKLKAHSVKSILEHAKCKWVFISEDLKQLLEDALDGDSIEPNIILFNGSGKQKDELDPLDLFINKGSEQQAIALIPPKPNDAALLLYTSGTTDATKGVMLTHGNIASNVESVCTLFAFSSADRFFALLPLCHTYAITADFLIPIYIGATVTYASGIKGSSMLDEMRNNKTTVLIAVPAIIELILHGILRNIRLLPARQRFLFKFFKTFSRIGQFLHLPLSKILFHKLRSRLSPSLKFFISGGAPLSKDIIQAFSIFGITIYQGYGLTETSPILSVNSPDQNVMGSVGKPIPGVQVKIHDTEIFGRGPNIMRGYYKNEKATEEVIRDGWFHTGDIGYFDRHGFLYISGRLKNLIVSRGGKNIYPEEVEMELLKSSWVKEACVLGQKRERKEHGADEQVYALIVPDYENIIANERSTDSDHIHNLISQSVKEANSRLADYKHIVGIEIWDELPKTTTLKLKRKEIKELFANKQTPQTEQNWN